MSQAAHTIQCIRRSTLTMQCNPTRSIRNIHQLGLLGHPTRRKLVCVMRHMHFLLQEKHQLDSMWKNGMCGSSCDALNGIVMISCILESVAECTHSKSYVNGQIIVKRTLKWSGQKSVNLRSNLSNRNVIFLFYHRKVRNRILSISVPHDFNRPVVSPTNLTTVECHIDPRHTVTIENSSDYAMLCAHRHIHIEIGRYQKQNNNERTNRQHVGMDGLRACACSPVRVCMYVRLLQEKQLNSFWWIRHTKNSIRFIVRVRVCVCVCATIPMPIRKSWSVCTALSIPRHTVRTLIHSLTEPRAVERNSVSSEARSIFSLCVQFSSSVQMYERKALGRQSFIGSHTKRVYLWSRCAFRNQTKIQSKIKIVTNRKTQYFDGAFCPRGNQSLQINRIIFALVDAKIKWKSIFWTEKKFT